MKRGRKSKEAASAINLKKKGAIRSIGKKIKDLEKEVKDKKKALETVDEADNDKSAMQMLQDLRYAYRNAVSADGKKGRQRLLDLMKNDVDFKFAMKELMRIEASIASAKVRLREDPDSNMTTFVIIKGLEGSEKAKVSDPFLDLEQIADAFNPSTETREAYEPEMEGPKPE